MVIKQRDISGQAIPGGQDIAAGALQETTTQIPDNVENSDSYQFTANIDQSYVFPSALTDSCFLVGLAIECDSTTNNDSLLSSANWNHSVQGNSAFNLRSTSVSGPTNDRHNRVIWLELVNPDAGSGNIQINFNVEANISDGSMAVYALSDIHQNGFDVAETYSDPNSDLATVDITPLFENSLLFSICSHGQQASLGGGPWTAQTGQTVLFDANGDNGATTSQNAAAGYRLLSSVIEYTETWAHGGGTPLRSVMSAIIYGQARAPQVYIPDSLSYSKIRHLRM